jgi:hypothetical protein
LRLYRSKDAQVVTKLRLHFGLVVKSHLGITPPVLFQRSLTEFGGLHHTNHVGRFQCRLYQNNSTQIKLHNNPAADAEFTMPSRRDHRSFLSHDKVGKIALRLCAVIGWLPFSGKWCNILEMGQKNTQSLRSPESICLSSSSRSLSLSLHCYYFCSSIVSATCFMKCFVFHSWTETLRRA